MDWRPRQTKALSDLPLFAAGAADPGDRLEHGPAVPYQQHSATSRAAATALRASGRAASLERDALAVFVRRGETGCTDEALDELMWWLLGREVRSPMRPRRVALWHRGYVEDSGLVDLTRSGRFATVWRVTAAGRQKWAELVAAEAQEVGE